MINLKYILVFCLLEKCFSSKAGKSDFGLALKDATKEMKLEYIYEDSCYCMSHVVIDYESLCNS